MACRQTYLDVLQADGLAGGWFVGVDFSGRNFRRADFAGARCSGASFQGADLRDADFRGAFLDGADLLVAHLIDLVQITHFDQRHRAGRFHHEPSPAGTTAPTALCIWASAMRKSHMASTS